MGLFFLLTLYCAIRASGAGRARVWAACAVACCALGMATKEVMAAAPPVVALWDSIFSERDSHRVRWPLCAALASTWVILAALLFHEHRGPSIDLSPGIVWRYALTQTEIVTHYWPACARAVPAGVHVRLAACGVAERGRGAGSVPSGARRPCGFRCGQTRHTRLCRRVVPPDTCAYLQCPPIVTEVAAEHRMYLPLAAVVACAVVAGWLGTNALLSWFVPDPHGRARAVTAVAALLTAAVAIACGLGTRARNEDYTSGERLWRDTVEKQPANQRALVALGEVLARSGRYAESEAQLRRAVDLAQADPVARVRLGSVVAAQGRLDEAIRQWELALGSRPDDADAHRFLGRAYAMRGQDALAVGHLDRLLETRKDDPAILEELAAILANSADVAVRNGAKAVAAADRAVQLTGRQDARALEILAVAQSAEGRPAEAVSAAREALRIARAQGDPARIAELENRVKFLESRAPTQPPRSRISRHGRPGVVAPARGPSAASFGRQSSPPPATRSRWPSCGTCPRSCPRRAGCRCLRPEGRPTPARARS